MEPLQLYGGCLRPRQKRRKETPGHEFLQCPSKLHRPSASVVNNTVHAHHTFRTMANVGQGCIAGPRARRRAQANRAGEDDGTRIEDYRCAYAWRTHGRSQMGGWPPLSDLGRARATSHRRRWWSFTTVRARSWEESALGSTLRMRRR